MSLVHIFLANGFEEVEGLTAVDLLRRAGCDVKTVSIMDRRVVTGSHQIKVIADMMFDDIKDEADLVVLPGGLPGTNYLRDHKGLAALLQARYEKGALIAAICAAPSVFEGLGFLKDRQATSYPGAIGEAIGEYLTTPVVVSDHVITSRGVGTAIPFALKLIEILCGAEKANEIESSILYK